MLQHERTSAIRELTEHEVDTVSGGLDIGPIKVEAGDGLVSISVGGYMESGLDKVASA